SGICFVTSACLSRATSLASGERSLSTFVGSRASVCLLEILLSSVTKTGGAECPTPPDFAQSLRIKQDSLNPLVGTVRQQRPGCAPTARQLPPRLFLPRRYPAARRPRGRAHR